MGNIKINQIKMYECSNCKFRSETKKDTEEHIKKDHAEEDQNESQEAQRHNNKAIRYMSTLRKEGAQICP